MNARTLTSPVFALGLVLAGAVGAMELPPAPANFTWRVVPEIKAAFLVPSGWYFKREERPGTLAYFITQQDIDKERRFVTGLTINVFRRAKPGTAVEYAQAFIAQAASKAKAEAWKRDFGPLRGFGCRFEKGEAAGALVLHMLMVANPRTGTLYLFMFEAPETQWEAAWATGETIMNLLLVDDEI